MSSSSLSDEDSSLPPCTFSPLDCPSEIFSCQWFDSSNEGQYGLFDGDRHDDILPSYGDSFTRRLTFAVGMIDGGILIGKVNFTKSERRNNLEKFINTKKNIQVEIEQNDQSESENENNNKNTTRKAATTKKFIAQHSPSSSEHGESEEDNDDDDDSDSDASSISITTDDYLPPSILHSLTPHSSSVRSLSLHSHLLLSASSDTNIHVYDVNSLSPMLNIEKAHSHPINVIQYNNWGAPLIITGDDEGGVKIFDMRRGEGRGGKKEVMKWENKNNKNKNIFNDHNKNAKTKNAKFAAKKSDYADKITSSSLASNSPTSSHYESIFLNDHGDYVSDIAIGKSLKALKTHPASSSSSSSSSSPSSFTPFRFSTCAGDGYLLVYDVRTNRSDSSDLDCIYYASSDPLNDDLLSMRYLHHCSTLIVGGKSGELHLFDHSKSHFGVPYQSYKGHPDTVNTMEIIDDENGILATGSNDGVVRLLRIKPNKLIGPIQIHDEGGAVEQLSMGRKVEVEGREVQLLMSGGHDKKIRITDVTDFTKGGWEEGEEEVEEEGESDSDDSEEEGEKNGENEEDGNKMKDEDDDNDNESDDNDDDSDDIPKGKSPIRKSKFSTHNDNDNDDNDGDESDDDSDGDSDSDSDSDGKHKSSPSTSQSKQSSSSSVPSPSPSVNPSHSKFILSLKQKIQEAKAKRVAQGKSEELTSSEDDDDDDGEEDEDMDVESQESDEEVQQEEKESGKQGTKKGKGKNALPLPFSLPNSSRATQPRPRPVSPTEESQNRKKKKSKISKAGKSTFYDDM